MTRTSGEAPESLVIRPTRRWLGGVLGWLPLVLGIVALIALWPLGMSEQNSRAGFAIHGTVILLLVGVVTSGFWLFLGRDQIVVDEHGVKCGSRPGIKPRGFRWDQISALGWAPGAASPFPGGPSALVLVPESADSSLGSRLPIRLGSVSVHGDALHRDISRNLRRWAEHTGVGFADSGWLLLDDTVPHPKRSRRDASA